LDINVLPLLSPGLAERFRLRERNNSVPPVCSVVLAVWLKIAEMKEAADGYAGGYP